MHVKQAIVVEGRYDKIKLDSLVNALVIPTNGFDLFKDKEKQQLLRTLAEKRGLVVLTDSDVAGFRIRNFIKGIIPKEQVIHAYIPDIKGKEKRKEHPSKEGKLGVEGVPAQVLLHALTQAGVLREGAMEKAGRAITKQDFYEWGLTGAADSALCRQRLIEALGLPEYLTANALIPLLNGMFSFEEWEKMMKDLGMGREIKTDA